jgi:hypothetical protein
MDGRYITTGEREGHIPQIARVLQVPVPDKRVHEVDFAWLDHHSPLALNTKIHPETSQGICQLDARFIIVIDGSMFRKMTTN